MASFIMDRTQSDVTRRAELAKKGIPNMTSDELAEWLAPSKGAYNYTDLNRVENAVANVYALMQTLSRDTSPCHTRQWSADDMPTSAEMRRYIANIQMIRAAFPEMHYAMPEAPKSMSNLTYEGANAIEEILYYATEYAKKKIQQFPFSGEIFGGEV